MGETEPVQLQMKVVRTVVHPFPSSELC